MQIKIFNSFGFGCVFYLSNIMWIYIIILVFVFCLFSLRPYSGLIQNQLPKVICNKKENIKDLVLLPQAPVVSLVKH
jgi:hypothetical protein